MEVDLRKGTDGSIKNSDNVSKSGHSQAVMVSRELVLSNNHEQDTYKGDHFSIRGYVAEVRKREMKLCWPLFKLHDCTSDEQPNLAPPLFVKKFRRWNCQNCLYEISDSETGIENGMTMNIQNDLVKNDYPSSTGNTTVEAPPPTIKTSLPHQSDERVVEKNNSFPGSNGECRPLICCGQQVNDLQSSDFTKEGISIPRGGQDKCHKDQKCMSPTIIVAREGEAFQEGNITVRSNTSEDAILRKQKIDIVLPSKRKDTELVHGFGVTEHSNKVIASTSFTVPIPDQKDDHEINETMKLKDLCKNVVKDFRMPWKDNAIQPSLHDRDSHEETNADTDVIDAVIHTRDDVVNPAGSVDRPQNKRAPKLRSLYDILRSEEIRKPEKFGISSGGAGTSDNDNDEKLSIGRGNLGLNGNYSGKSDKSKSEDKTPDYRSDLVTQKAESKPNRKKTIPSDGYGRCLIRWLKRVPRKAKSHKGDAQGKHIDTEVDKCRSAVVRDLDLNREYCGEEDEQEIIGEKSNLMTDVEIIQPPCMTKEDELPLKGHMIIQHQPAYASHSTSPRSKLSVVTKFKDIHHGSKTQERGDKMSLSNKKNKRPRTEMSFPSRTQWLKRNDFQLHKKGTKKQITTRTSEQQDEDDIPMDIVELLAKNQHERRLMNGMTNNGSTCNLSVMTEGMKEGNRCSMADYGSNHNLPMMTGITKDVNMWSIGGAHGKMVSDEMHWRISPEESQSNFKEYNYRMAVGNDRKVGCDPKSYHSYSMSKQNHHIDLNQEAPISASIDYPASSQSVVGLSVSADQPPNRNFYPQNVYPNRMEMLALCSDHINHTTPGHNFSSFIHDESSVPVNGTPGFRNFDLNFNSDDIYPRGTPKTVTHNAGYQMMIDMSCKHLQNYKAKDESSINEGRTSATKPCALSVNGHNLKMMDPVDLDTNETISALNLLRLMDQAACSGEPPRSSIHNIRSTQLGQGNELLRSDVGVRSSEAAKLPRIVDKPDQDQQPRNSGIPFRPVARVGVLGPLLQKEIATSSTNSKPSFGFQASSEQSSLKTNAMGKGEAFHSATVTKTMNAQTSISRDVSSKEVGYSIGSLENTGCSVTGNSIVQHTTNNKNDTLQPVRSTCKTEVCVLNRNPADFAMPDEDSEYMIGYKEHRRKYTPRSRNLQSPSHLKGKKRQRVMKVNNLKG